LRVLKFCTNDKEVHMKTLFFFSSLLACLIWANLSSAATTTAQNSFEPFCSKWLQVMNNYAPKKMTSKPTGKSYVAEYVGYSEPISTQVRLADSTKGSYVGVLSYKELTLQHEGDTSEDAKRGPFHVVKEANIKAIFLYYKGEWLR
jgi:hypothetical protein